MIKSGNYSEVNDPLWKAEVKPVKTNERKRRRKRLFASGGQSWSSYWAQPFKVIETTDDDRYRFIATTVQNPLDTNILCCLYTNGFDHDGVGKHISIRVSTNKGRSFGEEQTVFTTDEDRTGMSQACGYDASGRLHLLVTDVKIADNTCKLYYSYSDNNGTTWAEFEDISSVIADVAKPVYRVQNKIICSTGSNMMASAYRQDGDASDGDLLLLKFDGSDWSVVEVYSWVSASLGLNEGSLIYIGENKLLLLVREWSGTRSWGQFYSDDNGDTWTRKDTFAFLDYPEGAITAAQPCALEEFEIDEEPIVACYFPRHYENTKPLNVIYAKKSDLVTYNQFAWSHDSKKEILDYHPEVVKYGNLVHYDNNYGARGVWSLLNDNSGSVYSKLLTFVKDSRDYEDQKTYLTPIIPASDTDLDDYISLIELEDDGQIAGLRRFYYDIKRWGVWDKIKAAYPLIGGDAAKHVWNIKDLRDADAAFRLAFVNGAGVGWTHNANGILPDGTGSYARTFLSPASVLSQHSAHLAVYSQTESTASNTSVGVYTNEGTNPGISLAVNISGTATFFCYKASGSPATENVGVGSLTSSLGVTMGSRISNIDNRIYVRGRHRAVSTDEALNDATAYSFYIGALARKTTALSFSPVGLSYITIGDGLTPGEAERYSFAIERLQIDLGRGK